MEKFIAAATDASGWFIDNQAAAAALVQSGLILTFNIGRDITLLVLYPFVFGALVIWWLDRSPAGLRND